MPGRRYGPHVSSAAPTAAPSKLAQLDAWIADSTRRQQRAARLTLVLLVPALAACFVDRTVGVVATVLVGSIGFIAYWVTAAHISDWRQQQEHLRRTGRAR